MGEHTTNFNIDELISSYIDKQITDQETLKKVEDLIASDDNVSRKYKSELITKQMLSRRLQNVEVPKAVYIKVTSGIDQLISIAELNREENQKHSEQHAESFYQHLKNVVTAPIRIGSAPVPRYAFAMVLMVVVVTAGVYISSGSSGPANQRLMSGTDKNIVKQAVNNFHKILNGEIRPDSTPKTANEIRTQMSQEAEFPVYVPDISEYKLVGRICNKYNGQMLAHLIYKKGNDMIYILQTQSKCIERKDLEMPDEIRNEIKDHKYFMCDEIDIQNNTVTMWVQDNVMCTSVSNMPKQKMNTTFASFK